MRNDRLDLPPDGGVLRQSGAVCDLGELRSAGGDGAHDSRVFGKVSEALLLEDFRLHLSAHVAVAGEHEVDDVVGEGAA